MSKILIKNFKIHKLVCAIYGEFLLISFRAFLPSLRVLNTSQEREYSIRAVRIIKEIWVFSILVGI